MLNILHLSNNKEPGKQAPEEKANQNGKLFWIWVSVFLDVIGFAVLFPYLPRFYLDLGAALPRVGLYLSVGAMIGLFSNILWGRAADHFGRNRVLLVCRLGAAAGYLLLAMSKNITWLLVARVVDGIFSRTVPVSLAAISDLVPHERQSGEMSRIGIAWMVGGLIGPGIGAALALSGLFALGIFCAALTVASMLISLAVLRKDSHHRQDQKVPASENPAKKTALFSARVFKNPRARALLTQNIFAFLAYFTFSTATTLYMTKQFALTVAQIGTLLTSANILNLFVRLTIFPLVLRRLGDAKTYQLGLLAYLAAFAWLMVAADPVQFTLILVLTSFGTSCSLDVMNGRLSQAVSADQRGEIMGLNATAENVALIVGPIVAGNALAMPGI